MPQCITQIIHDEHLHPHYYLMMLTRAIPYLANTLKNIHLSYDSYNVFVSTLYNYKGFTFRFVFGEYTKLYLQIIDNPEIIEGWKLK